MNNNQYMPTSDYLSFVHNPDYSWGDLICYGRDIISVHPGGEIHLHRSETTWDAFHYTEPRPATPPNQLQLQQPRPSQPSPHDRLHQRVFQNATLQVNVQLAINERYARLHGRIDAIRSQLAATLGRAPTDDEVDAYTASDPVCDAISGVIGYYEDQRNLGQFTDVRTVNELVVHGTIEFAQAALRARVESLRAELTASLAAVPTDADLDAHAVRDPLCIAISDIIGQFERTLDSSSEGTE